MVEKECSWSTRPIRRNVRHTGRGGKKGVKVESEREEGGDAFISQRQCAEGVNDAQSTIIGLFDARRQRLLLSVIIAMATDNDGGGSSTSSRLKIKWVEPCVRSEIVELLFPGEGPRSALFEGMGVQ